MLRKKSEGVEWLEFSLLQQEGVKHGVFLRHGGVSKAPYESLNTGDNVEDAPENVEENKERIRKVLGLKRLAFVHQVHGKRVEEVGGKIASPNADAMITKERGIGLVIRHADCQAAIIYDRRKQVIANVHAGWRGNVMRIYEQVIKELQEKYSSDIKDLIVCISPSLGPENAEFINYKEELPESFLRYQEKKNHFNLWKAAKDELVSTGIPLEQIEIAEICTYAEEGDFFSYRRDGKTGRNATVVAL